MFSRVDDAVCAPVSLKSSNSRLSNPSRRIAFANRPEAWSLEIGRCAHISEHGLADDGMCARSCRRTEPIVSPAIELKDFQGSVPIPVEK